MELFDLLRNDENLKNYLRNECEDNGICVEFASEIDRKQVLIIKIDDYYNAQSLKKRPNSIDCLIIQFCGANKYTLNLVELKNVQDASNRSIPRKDLRAKFETTLYDFMSNRFRQYFNDSQFSFKYKLLLCAGKVKSQAIKAYSLDFLLSIRPFLFNNKVLAINGLPPHPLIKSCTK